MKKFKDIPLQFTVSAYIEFSRNICELDDFSKFLDEKSLAEKVEIISKILSICANGYVDCVNSGLAIDNNDSTKEKLKRYSWEYFSQTLSFKELNEGMSLCMEEINFSMGVDTPSDVKLKERDYELEELEKEKKSD